MYSTARTRARPPQVVRLPLWRPLSRLNGATPTRIRAALRRREVSEPSEPYALGDLTIDYAERVVTFAGRPVELMAIEYRMLFELSANAGRVLTYEHLLQRVWGREEHR